MCYRYSVPGPDLVKKECKVEIKEDFEKRYHVSAFEDVKLPVITNIEPKQVKLFSWGLIPFWVKDEKTAEEIKKRTVNARAETIFEKASFRNSAGKKHCLVISDGFFEWRYYKGKNYPYYIKLKDKKVFSIAGLWDSWFNKNTNEEIFTYTIITTDANPLMAKIHNKKKRMPAILSKEDEEKWISKEIKKDEIKNILRPFDENKMDAYTISKLITNKEMKPNVPEVIKPYNYEELRFEQKQKTLF